MNLAVKNMYCLGRAVVAHAFNPSTWEVEAGRFLSSRPAWSNRVSSRTARATQRNPVSKKKTKKTKQNKTCTALLEDVGSVPSTHSSQLTTASTLAPGESTCSVFRRHLSTPVLVHILRHT